MTSYVYAVQLVGNLIFTCFFKRLVGSNNAKTYTLAKIPEACALANLQIDPKDSNETTAEFFCPKIADEVPGGLNLLVVIFVILFFLGILMTYRIKKVMIVEYE